MSGLTAATLRAAMGGPLSLARYEQLLPSFTRFLLAADCTTVRRAAMAIAQTGHESVGLRYQREIWGPTAQQRKYDPASGSSLSRQLGNTQRGDGARYAGHGWLQVTGRGNHAAVSKWAHERGYVPSPTFFVDHPAELGSDQYAWIGPAWYWTAARPKLNARADAGDVVGATKLINGGTYGLDDRRRRFEACLRLGDRLLPAATAARSRPTPARPPAHEEDDMPSAEQVAEAVIRRLLPNPYTTRPDDQMNVGDTLAWGTAHAARALDGVNAILARLGSPKAMEDRILDVERKTDIVLEQQARILAALEKR